MKKFIITGAALAVLAVPSAAMADQETYQGYPTNESKAAQDWQNGTNEFKGSLVGEWTSRISHNGQYVQDQIGQMSEHGRSGVVQWVHSMDGKGQSTNDNK
jgi:hypothetical protein